MHEGMHTGIHSCAARADLQSARIEYKHLQCNYRIKNPDIIYIGITNPDERLGRDYKSR